MSKTRGIKIRIVTKAAFSLRAAQCCVPDKVERFAELLSSYRVPVIHLTKTEALQKHRIILAGVLLGSAVQILQHVLNRPLGCFWLQFK